MFIYPRIDPVAFRMGPLQVHWYGLMYLLSFLVIWGLMKHRVKKYHLDFTKEQIIDLIFYCAIGVVVGGRIGYMLFYGFPNLIHTPWILFEIWRGGMSFHGGFLGVLLMMWFWSYKTHKSFFEMTDFIAPLVPIGLGAGRIGNFINGYLMGRVTNMPWGFVYPNGGGLPRHPIEIYEFLLEGVLLFIILWCYSRKPRPKMAVSGLFLLCYGVFRFGIEFVRQPDAQLGFIAWNWLTMGQLLSFPMIVGGIFLLWFAKQKHQ